MHSATANEHGGSSTTAAIAVAAIVISGLLVAVGSVNSDATRMNNAGGTPLLPDLHPLRPTDISVDVSPSGKQSLQFSTIVTNAGPGPLELISQPQHCRAESADLQGRTAYQRVYLDSSADELFNRPEDIDYVDSEIGCFAYHSTHRHWHFRGLMQYELIDRKTRESIGQSKMGFCLLDVVPEDSSVPGFSARAYYEASGTKSTELPCLRDTMQGLSPGWGDIYSSDTPGQSIDITGITPGHYCLSFAVQSGTSHTIREVSTDNNRRGTGIILHTSGKITEQGTC